MYLMYEYKNNCGTHIWAYILWYIHYLNLSPCEWDIYIGFAACNQIESFNSYCQWVQQMTTVDQGTVSVNDQHHLMVTYSLKTELHLPHVWCFKLCCIKSIGIMKFIRHIWGQFVQRANHLKCHRFTWQLQIPQHKIYQSWLTDNNHQH